jgi:hypothetical protein
MCTGLDKGSHTNKLVGQNECDHMCDVADQTIEPVSAVSTGQCLDECFAWGEIRQNEVTDLVRKEREVDG